jgi:PncC family amidohydrolase
MPSHLNPTSQTPEKHVNHAKEEQDAKEGSHPDKDNTQQPPSSAAESQESPHSIASEILSHLSESNSTLAIAESLTGGALSSLFTTIPGSGSVFRGGIVAYDAPLKTKLLGISAESLEKNGVVSAETAAGMAKGVREAATCEGQEMTTWGLGTTGVAGPGETEGKDMGTVYIGVSKEGGESKGFGPFWFPGSREGIMDGTMREALKVLRGEILGVWKPRGEGKVL